MFVFVGNERYLLSWLYIIPYIYADDNKLVNTALYLYVPFAASLLLPLSLFCSLVIFDSSSSMKHKVQMHKVHHYLKTFVKRAAVLAVHHPGM